MPRTEIEATPQGMSVFLVVANFFTPRRFKRSANGRARKEEVRRAGHLNQHPAPSTSAVKPKDIAKTPSTAEPLVPWDELDVGVVVKIKGKPGQFREVKQIEVVKRIAKQEARHIAFYTSQGWVEGKVDLDRIIDTSFTDAAVKALGPYK